MHAGARQPSASGRGRRVGAAVAIALLAITASACGASSGNQKSASKTLRVGFERDVLTWDPDNSFETAGLGAIRSVYQGLVQYAPGSTKVVGLLATDWKISPDGKTYTFTLRKGVKFDDGSPLTSEAAKASLTRRWKDPKLTLSYFLYSVKKIETPDPQTLVLKLSAPQTSLIDNLASPWGPKIIGPDALTKHKGSDNSRAWLNGHADGTGPFRLTSAKTGQGYTLDRNPDYWGTPAKLEKVEISIVPDNGQRILKLRSGNLDAILNGYPFEQLKNLPSGLTVHSYRNTSLEVAAINVSGKLKDINVRHAVAAAIKPEEWRKDAFGEYSNAATSLFPASMIKTDQPFEVPPASGSPKVPPVRIAYISDDVATQSRVADLMIAQFHQAGIDASANAIPIDQALAYQKKPDKAPWDILVFSGIPDSAHPGSAATLFYGTGGGINWNGYSNPKVDKLFAEADAETDVPKRDALYLQGAKVAFDDFAFVPIAEVYDVQVFHGKYCDTNSTPAVPWQVDLGTVRPC